VYRSTDCRRFKLHIAAVQLRVVIIAICRTHHHLKIPLAAITVLPLYHRALVTTVG
jgi:hypothetical protein